MSDEPRKDTPIEPEPGAGRESQPWDAGQGPADLPPAANVPAEDAPLRTPEERLGEELGDTADSVTQQLRDLQDELIPRDVEEPLYTPPVTPLEPTVTVDTGTPGASAAPASAGPETWGAEAPRNESAPLPLPTTVSGETYRSTESAAAFTPEGTDDDRLMSMLAWLSMVILQLPVVSIIQLLSENTKNRPFQRHHAVTSLIFYAAAIVYEILAIIVFTILTAVTLGCGALCLWVIFFVPHALALYYAFQAYGGKRVNIRWLSDFGRQQGWL